MTAHQGRGDSVEMDKWDRTGMTKFIIKALGLVDLEI